MNQNDYVVLETSSWAGISLGAIHCYGHLYGYDENSTYNLKKMVVTKNITAEEAKALNKYDKHDSYVEGDVSYRFSSEEEVIKRAKEIWQDLFPNRKILFHGQFVVADPKEILVAPEPYFTKGNKIFQCVKNINFWNNDENSMELLCNQWDELFKGNI